MTSPKLEPIRVLIADDELPARQRLMDLLHKDEQVGTVLQAENGAIAVEMIERRLRRTFYFSMCRCRRLRWSWRDRRDWRELDAADGFCDRV